MYLDGVGVERDTKSALNWLALAAEAEVVKAQYLLGRTYHDGKLVEFDYEQALQWFELAADSNDANAQFRLGIMLQNGEGTAIDKQASVTWFRRAADQGHKFAIAALEPIDYRPSNEPEDDGLAFTWYLQGATDGYPEAQVELAKRLSASGDIDDAIAWYRTALELDFLGAEYPLVSLLFESNQYQSGAEIKRRLIGLSRGENTQATVLLGRLLSDPKWHMINYKRAIVLFSAAAVEGDCVAQYELGQLTQNGTGTQAHANKALLWYNLAAVQGNRQAIDASATLSSQLTNKAVSNTEKKVEQWLAENLATYSEENNCIDEELAIFY
jgi:hypothetical protein